MEGGKRKEAEMSGMIDKWLRKHRLIYLGATRHPLILSVRDGSVDLSSFKTWLGQDYVFVREFVGFVASLLVKACKQSESDDDVELILGGLASLSDEIQWFKKEASKWEIQLSSVVPQKPNQDYCRFVESLMGTGVDYSVAITAFWGIEAVYQESFAHCLEENSNTPPELQEICKRWGNAEFGEYCSSLKNIANRCLEKASDDELTKAEVTLIRVLEHEVDFWNMSKG